MLDGNAAFAEVELPTVDSPTPLLVYSAHLSVRCEPSKRAAEIRAVLSHAEAQQAEARQAAAAGRTGAPAALPVIVGGDMNTDDTLLGSERPLLCAGARLSPARPAPQSCTAACASAALLPPPCATRLRAAAA